VTINTQKILVTGTAGFIGFHLAKRFLERGDEVIGLDNINDYYDVNLKYARLKETGISRNDIEWNKIVKSTKYPNYKFIRLNLEDRDNILNLFKKERFNKVCNLAAQAGVRYSLKNPYAYIDSNIVGFINILEASRVCKIKHLVYASSSSVYGNNTKMPLSTSDRVDHPISLYAATKKSNELMAYTYSHLYNLPTSGLRFFTVYGPWGRPDMALFLFTKTILEDKPIDVFNHGNMVRDFTYIDDIVEGVTHVIDNPPSISANSLTKKSSSNYTNYTKKNNSLNSRNSMTNNSMTAPYKIYNIGNSSPVNLLDFIKAIEKSLGKKAKMHMLPMQSGDVRKTHSDVSDLVDNFGYKPETPIQKGVEEFIKWYMSTNYIY
jgi:UDP-glucuronate 4-epimerase